METRRDRLSLRGDTIYPNFKPIICDYILIGDGYHGTLNHILRHYNPIVIIIMPEVYKEKQISFMNEKLTRNTKIHFIKNDGTLIRSVFRGFWLNTPTLCSECKKVGHNIVYYDNIIIIYILVYCNSFL